MRERPRPEPPTPPPFCFCFRRRGKRCVALGVAAALAAAGTLRWTIPTNRQQRLDPGRGAAKASPGVTSAVEKKNKNGREGGEKGEGGLAAGGGGGRAGGAGAGSLPRCFSSPEADPSDGAWRATGNGVRDSPAYSGDAEFPSQQFDFLQK